MTQIQVVAADQSAVDVETIDSLRSLFFSGCTGVTFRWGGAWTLEVISVVIGSLSEMVGLFGETLIRITWVVERDHHQGLIKEFLS